MKTPLTPLLFVSVFGFPLSAFSQGALAPPSGTPAPSFKTLQQVEPRTDVANLTGDANNEFIIDKPGSYYFSGNISVSKTNGIQISAEGVALDLNGFEIVRKSGTGGSGIQIAATSHRTEVRHGSIKGFDNGIESVFGASYPRACGFYDLTVTGCQVAGILAGNGAVLNSCRAHGNTGTWAIIAAAGATLMNCTATNNTVTNGIYGDIGATMINCIAANNTANFGVGGGVGSTLINCAAFSNTSGAATSGGISLGTGSMAVHCNAYLNSSSAAATPSTGAGIVAASSSNIIECTTNNNRGDGILIDSSSTARENNCRNNGLGGDGAGIHAIGANNRIEANNVVLNSRGIDTDDSATVKNNVIIHNTAMCNPGAGTTNATNYAVDANDDVGPIGLAASAASPWANISIIGSCP